MHKKYRHILQSDAILICVIFIVSRFIYINYLDLNFNSNTINYYWQYLDPQLLREDLLRSVFYLHQQPPLFNLYLGVILKLFPTQYPAAFQLSFAIIGLVFSLYLFFLMKHIGISRFIAFGLVLIFICSPTTLMYENWLFYTYPAAFLLCVSTYYLVMFLKYRKWQYIFGFFIALTILTLTRSIFRVEILCFFFLVLFAVCKSDRKVILQTFIFPFIILSLYSIKQYVVFGTIHAGTSYVGRNLPERTAGFLSQEERQALSQSGLLPSFYFNNPNQVISSYPELDLPKATGIPALDQQKRSTGKINFNHLGYLTLSDAYMNGLFETLKRYPMSYFKSFFITQIYFSPASQDGLARKVNNNNRVGKLSDYYDRIFLLKPPSSRLAWGLIVGLPALIIFGIVKAWRLYTKAPQNYMCWLPLCFITFTILYFSAVTTGISTGDFNRYRVEFDCLYIVLLGIFLTDVSTKFRRGVLHLKQLPDEG